MSEGIQWLSKVVVTAVANGNPCNIIAVNKLMADDRSDCKPKAKPSKRLWKIMPNKKKTTSFFCKKRQIIYRETQKINEKVTSLKDKFEKHYNSYSELALNWKICVKVCRQSWSDTLKFPLIKTICLLVLLVWPFYPPICLGWPRHCILHWCWPLMQTLKAAKSHSILANRQNSH